MLWQDGKRLKAVLLGKGPTDLGFDLQQGVSQGTVSVTLGSGGLRVCAACSASGAQDGSNGKKFSGKLCPAPVSCTP